MVGWHVNDIKISHSNQAMVESIIGLLEQEFGKETLPTVDMGHVHKYLGMAINYSELGKVKFTMPDYIQGLVDECPDNLRKGTATTPAVNHLF